MAVGVKEPQVEDADAVDVLGVEAAGPDFAAVTGMGGELLQGAKLGEDHRPTAGRRSGLRPLREVEDWVRCTHKDRCWDLGTVVVVQQVGCHLSDGSLSHLHRGFHAGVSKAAPNKAFGVVGGKGLLVARLHECCLLARLVHEEIRSSEAVRGGLGLLLGPDAPGHRPDEPPAAGVEVGAAHNLYAPGHWRGLAISVVHGGDLTWGADVAQLKQPIDSNFAVHVHGT
mmetsp:Transcript_39674/g.112546  ORF Transcript_39674/g.112546 Transcript_39674/m.112546 type:complete len:227 (-) Transcript_39674:315-995(-)